ncbi:SDR family NAD(P)-dependent oxidoreductase [Kibdelosporangium aridum]|uniref:SDR family NAD(P)-dependent oxidoreductase n=1 Tax=Kibdelosporangium aridum TaxID=2030 RepID=A0A428Z2E1_KIBAR|nr:SDR family oxidoreductase [Kibdelosporangium aridum]RSM79485.1 SDR family NAD(P)-dependent oxidoreductase [Kibdelosporangium aridum]
MSKIVIISGASSGFGALTARALVDAGHTAYAGMRNIAGRNAIAAAEAKAYNDRLRPVEMDVLDQRSVDAAVAKVIADEGRLDVIVHNAGHMVLGAAEAFTPDQYASVYDTNVLSTQRLNRAALPQLRKQGDGLVVWVGSSSTRGGTPPFLAPYFAAKAAMDALAVSYATELTRFGVDSTIIVPGAFTRGTNHFANAGYAADEEVAAEYDAKYSGFSEEVARRLADLLPPDADPAEVARQIVRVVDLPKGQRPFRVHVDPSEDGAELVNAVGDAVRQQFYRRIGYPELLTPVH